ncbi:unnamed protein product [Cuscuta europaea]|nr:unnamed protein product [Cuscuta europaea]
MSRVGGKTQVEQEQMRHHGYEQQRLKNIEANKFIMKSLGIKRIAASKLSLVDSTTKKKRKMKSKSSVEEVADNGPVEDNNEVEAIIPVARRTRGAQVKGLAEKRNFIPPSSLAKLCRTNKKQQSVLGNEALRSLSSVIKDVQQDITSPEQETDQDPIAFDEDMDEQRNGNSEDSIMEKDDDDEDVATLSITTRYDSDPPDALMARNDKVHVSKKKKVYKTKTPRGPTRNLFMAKMRPGEKKRVDFNIKGQPIGINRASLANYCGALVRDPLNAPLYNVKDFSEIPETNKETMWELILEKFDIGLEDAEDEEYREKIKKERQRTLMRSLNKKYRNYRARLKSTFYDTHETDADRLKKENRPPYVDEKDWKWLVQYFGSPDFQKMNKRNSNNRSYLDAGHTAGSKSFAQVVEDMFQDDQVMPGVLKVYQKTHTRSDKTPVTNVAKETMLKINKLVEQREQGEINMTDEEIYAKVKPKGKNDRDRGKGVSPSITSLFGSFSEGEKFRKEAEEAKKEANEAKKEAHEAKAKNKMLTKEVKIFKKEVRIMKGVMGKFFNLMGGDFSKLFLNEVEKEHKKVHDDDSSDGDGDDDDDDDDDGGGDDDDNDDDDDDGDDDDRDDCDDSDADDEE